MTSVWSPARRGAALGSAIVLYGPFGFTWTHAYLSRFGGPLAATRGP
ncbi:hypothetical protein ACU686_22300 [Yinghuangia aomiensis]